jgi:hypothetical protein
MGEGRARVGRDGRLKQHATEDQPGSGPLRVDT